MSQYYNRYKQFTINGKNITVPFLGLPSKPSDKKVIYKIGKSRLDKLSQLYYNSPYFGWLILEANPGIGSIEWDIPDGRLLTVPYPLIASLQDYKQRADNYFFYYGK